MLQEDILISEDTSIKEVLKKLDKTAKKVLLTTDGTNRLLGTITDGDVRRYILSGKSLENDISKVYNKKPIFIKREDFSMDLAKDILLKSQIDLVPIVDGENRVVDFVTWAQVFSGERTNIARAKKVNIPVVIMAGGKGSRLEPFTKILPKPLIPIGGKTIIEMIMDEFKKQGVSAYYLMLNHKSDMVKSYFKSVENDYKIKYVTEESILGTAGGLKLIEKEISDTFIVSNCDVMVKADFYDVLSLHERKKALLTVLSSIQHYKIPYGIIKFKKGGKILHINEKPEYTLNVNTGVYILNKESLKFIPEKMSFDMTDLIRVLVGSKKTVVMYPVNENDYMDIGQWEEYKKTVDKLQLFT